MSLVSGYQNIFLFQIFNLLGALVRCTGPLACFAVEKRKEEGEEEEEGEKHVLSIRKINSY